MQSYNINSVRLPGGHEIQMIYVPKGDFCLSQNLISQSIWTEIMGVNPSAFKDPKLAVGNVSAKELVQFLALLNKRTGSWSNPYRLPSEEEWELAAKGEIGDEGVEFSGSSKASKIAWADYFSSHQEPQISGMKSPNNLGFYDMAGNMWEWVTRSQIDSSDMLDEKLDKRFILCGGSYRYSYEKARLGSRFKADSDIKDIDFSFRVAKSGDFM